MKLKIVAFDPSLSNWGCAHALLDLENMTFVITELTMICTEPEKDKKLRKTVRKNSEDLDRTRILHRGIINHTKDAWIAIAEMPVGSQSSRAMFSYGACIGILAACPIPLIQVTPSETKMAGAGTKTATKEEMIEWALSKYPDAPWPMKMVKGVSTPISSRCEHLADAVATLEAGIATDEFGQIVAIAKGSIFNERAFA